MGVNTREQLDDPNQHPKMIYTLLGLDFNNQEIQLDLPAAADDVDGFFDLNPNDDRRIRIVRDCMFILNYVLILCIILTRIDLNIFYHREMG
jgi:hypothetical protein